MKSSIGATLKIHCPNLVPTDAKIELDGVDITCICKGVTVMFDADDVTIATLNILVDKLDVTAETLAMLEAHVKIACTKKATGQTSYGPCS